MSFIPGLKEALKVDGWMSETELVFLAENASKAATALQVGCYKGRSSIVIGENIHFSLLDIDSFIGDFGNTLSTEDLAWAYKANVKSLLGSKIELIVGDSHEVLKTLNRTFDMIFIDGSHTYADAKKDIELAIPLLNPGGLLCGHDYSYSADVKRAVDEVFRGRAKVYGTTSIWYLKDLETMTTSMADNITKARAAIASGLKKLHLGCGRRIMPGYINIDLYRPEADLQLDVTDLSVFEDKSIDEIYMNAVLEHLFVFEQKKALSEWKRVLKPNGILKIDSTPDFDEVVKAYNGSMKGNTREKFDIEEVVRYTHGEYGEDDKIGGIHKDVFTKNKMKKLLEDAGFEVDHIESVSWGNEPHPVNINVSATRKPDSVTSSSDKTTFGAVYCVYDDETWLKESVASVYDACTAIYFLVADKPWHGDITDNSNTLHCIGGLSDPDKKIHVIKGSWDGETNQRNAGLDILRDEGIAYCFVVDADEIYDPEELKQMMLYASQQASVACWHMTWDTYWKSYMYVVSPREPFKPVVFVKVTEARFTEYRSVGTESHGFIPAEVGYCHHMSYARSNEQILKKITTFSHAKEVRENWFEKVWMNWRPDNAITNIHPTHPASYERAVRQPLISLPPILKDYATRHVDLRSSMPGAVSVVILTFNQLQYTKKCVESLRKHTPEPHEIIFVDNGSTDSTVKWLKTLTKENKNYRLIENKQNLGFAKGCNQGIEASQGEFILLLNNDVVVGEGWLFGLLNCLNHGPAAGIVGPMTNNISGPQQVVSDEYRSVDDLDRYVVRFRKLYHHRRIPLRRVVGFCMLFKRALAEQIGLLDESFGTGNFEDDDFCLRAALAGYNNYIAGDIFIHHYGSRSFIGNKIDYNTSMSGNRRIIEKKWTLSASSPEGKKLAVLKALESADDFYQKGRTDQAIEALINCIKLTPDAKEIYYELALIFIEANNFSEAWEVVESMPEAAKNDLKGLEYAGYIKEGLGMDDEAAAYADKMLSMNEHSTSALNLKGVLAYKKGEKEKAADYFKKAIDIDPGYGKPYTNVGVLYWSIEKKDEALAHLRHGFVLSPMFPDISSLYYSIVSSLGTQHDAEDDFREACRLYPNSKHLAFLYIDILIQQAKFDSAILRIEDSLEAFGHDEGTLNAALTIREKTGPLQVEKASKKNTLSVCMIVKNEEKNIVKCLKSVRAIVDEMIIVDTGSTDKTKDIAKIFGAKVFDFPWTGDFSLARNHSLAQASGDWILILDADEVISTLDHKRLLKTIDRGNKRPVAFDMATRNYLGKSGSTGWAENDGAYPQEEKGMGWYASNKVRLFRNNSIVRFQNTVHELLEESLHKAGIPIEKCIIPIHHYGRLDHDRFLAKGREYYLLGRNKLEERGGGDYVALRELAVQAGELGMHEEAIDLWQQLLIVCPDNVDSLYNLGYHYMQIGKYQEALYASKKAVELSPGTKGAVLNYALCELLRGNVLKAKDLLEKSESSENKHSTMMAVLGASYFISGNNNRGTAIFEKLAKKQINGAMYVNDLLKKLIASGQTEYAKLLIDATLSGDVADGETFRLRDAIYN
jgi:GT2 family glycosyltransferase/Flp pilus assembly protein TadD/predicted SAM-dependent methyltransferase/predicted O-methyltransferase YrrM